MTTLARLPLWQRRPILLVTLWLSISVILAIWGWRVGMDTVLPGPSSKSALLNYPGEQIALAAGIAPVDNLVLVLNHPIEQAEAPAFRTAVANIVELLRAQRHSGNAPLFTTVRTYGHSAFIDERDKFVSADGRSVLIVASTSQPIYDAAATLQPIPRLLTEWQQRFSGFTLTYLSKGTGDAEIFELINTDLDHSLVFTLPITLLILLWAFRSLIAASLPLVIAIVSLVASLGVSALLSHTWGAVSATAGQLVVLLVLALGVDYSLFMVSRLREELCSGLTYVEAVTRAVTTTGRAIIVSGLTVACSLFGLLLMQDAILTSMAHVAIVALATTLLSTVYVLPAMMVMLRNRLETLASDREGRFFAVSVRYPVTVTTGTLILLATLSAPLLSMKLGSTMEQDMLPGSMQSATGYSMLKSKFPEMAGTSFSIVLQTKGTKQLSDELLDDFFDSLVTTNEVSGPIEVMLSADGRTGRYQFIAPGNGNHSINQTLVDTIRSKYIPQLFEQHGIEGYVTGVLPYVTDEASRYRQRTPRVIIAVLATSFLFLLVAFRSLAVAGKAIILNTLSTSAAFGILVLLFQRNLVSSWNYGVIESFVPALLFSILFGLSMDYHVILISRIQEEVQQGKSTELAIQRGIVSTYRVITSAALIMTSVFVVIACLELPIMKQLGTGLALAVLIDATIIRTLLLPATMVLLGQWNWYFPRWLSWLPSFKHN